MAVLSHLKAVLSLDNKKFKKGLDESKQSTKSFGSAITKVGGLIAAAFTTKFIVDFGKELFLLGESVERVEKAFVALNDRTLLDDLRRATGNTVNDLRLMQLAVRSENLGLPIKQLATYFEFATIRAAETGESVDYLVNSIVDGIGRKSILIMDNLGISAVALQNEFKKTGDFAIAAGNLIGDALANSTLTIDEAAKASDQLATAWENVKIALSSIANDPFNVALLQLMAKVLGGAATKPIEIEFKTSSGVITDAFLAGQTAEGLNKLLQEETRQRESYLNNYRTKQKQEERAFWAGYADVALENIERINVALDTLGSKKTGQQTESTGTVRLEQNITPLESIAPIIDLTAESFENALVPMERFIEKTEEIRLGIISIGEIMNTLLASAFQSFTRMVQDIVSGGNILAAFGTFLQDLGNMMAQYGAALIAFGIAENAFLSGDAYTKIAAGAVMLAAGLALGVIGGQINKSGGAGISGSGTYSGAYSGSYGGGYNSAYDYNREIVMVARGEDLVATINRQNYRDGING